MSSERGRTESSSSESSISGIPVALRRDSDVLGLPVVRPMQDNSKKEDEEAAIVASSSKACNNVSLDFSYLELDFDSIEMTLNSHALRAELITTLNLSGNDMSDLPSMIEGLVNLRLLDISHNSLKFLPDSLNNLSHLTTLLASSNQLVVESFSKDFGISLSSSLKVLNLGGNLLTGIPFQVLQLMQLRSLYLGSNQITEIASEICRLENLRVLYVGGNRLTHVPTELGHLPHLHSLSLCENHLVSLPASIAMLRNLKSLALHKNQLTALPPEILKLRGLHELSLRNNPLVCRFVKDFTFDCPSLLELAGRSIKSNRVHYDPNMLPHHLVHYLETARRCVNAKCKGDFSYCN